MSAPGVATFKVVWLAPNQKAPATVVSSGLTEADATARCDRLNHETEGAAGRYAVQSDGSRRTE